MAEKYRLLRDMPGAIAGTIFYENANFNGPLAYKPATSATPALSVAAVENTKWFEPIEERWKPTLGQDYYVVLGDGEVMKFKWSAGEYDEQVFAFGNCFQGRCLAESAAPELKACLMKCHKESK